MKKKIVLLVLINILVCFVVYLMQPLCEPCIKGIECPPCISNDQILLVVILVLFDIIYLMKILNTKKSNKLG